MIKNSLESGQGLVAARHRCRNETGNGSGGCLSAFVATDNFRQIRFSPLKFPPWICTYKLRCTVVVNGRYHWNTHEINSTIKSEHHTHICMYTLSTTKRLISVGKKFHIIIQLWTVHVGEYCVHVLCDNKKSFRVWNTTGKRAQKPWKSSVKPVLLHRAFVGFDLQGCSNVRPRAISIVGFVHLIYRTFDTPISKPTVKFDFQYGIPYTQIRIIHTSDSTPSNIFLSAFLRINIIHFF